MSILMRPARTRACAHFDAAKQSSGLDMALYPEAKLFNAKCATVLFSYGPQGARWRVDHGAVVGARLNTTSAHSHTKSVLPRNNKPPSRLHCQ